MKQNNYFVGEEKLSTIGKAVGNLTPTMINKISDTASGKLQIFTGVKRGDKVIDPKIMEDSIAQILKVRESSAAEFSKKLVKERSVKSFLNLLNNEKIFTRREFDLISENEKFGLRELKKIKTQEVISEMLLVDLEEEDNLFTTFQTYVSRKFFPKGRKKAKKQ